MFRLCVGVLCFVLLSLPALAKPAVQIKGDAAAVAEGNNGFAVDLYGKLAAQEGNLFFSPYSISNALAMTYAGTRGDTAKEIATTLHFDLQPEKFHPAFASLVKDLQGDAKKRKFALSIANRLWGQKDYGFLPEFIKLSQDQYQAGLKEVDFIRATEKARKEINQWVEDKTNQKIKELLKPGILNVDTRMVLTNAIYFKAAWMAPFNPKQTKPGDFFIGDDKKVEVPLMHASQRTNFFSDDALSALELPYENHELSMVLLLPKKKDALANLEKSLTAANLKKWLGKLSDHQVQITLPKFKMTSEFRLDKVLSEMGMPSAFDPRKADFSGLTTREKLFIQAVVHKAFVDVNEAGTEAAAATAVVIGRQSRPPAGTFTADHPFVFLIREARTGSILFMGRVANPAG